MQKREKLKNLIASFFKKLSKSGRNTKNFQSKCIKIESTCTNSFTPLTDFLHPLNYFVNFSHPFKNIAKILSIPVDSVSIKATTTDRLGFTGTGEGIAAIAVILLAEIDGN